MDKAYVGPTIVVCITDSEIQLIRLVFGKVIRINIIGRDEIAADENSQPINALVFCVKMHFRS